MKNAEYKGEIYNIETIYVYDEYISLYKWNLLETEPIKVALSEVKILPIRRVSNNEVAVCECSNPEGTTVNKINNKWICCVCNRPLAN